MAQPILLALVVLSLAAGVPDDFNAAYEKAFRASYRSHSIASCEKTILSKDPRDTNAHDFCACVEDKILASSTLAQLSEEPPLLPSKTVGADCFSLHLPPYMTPVLWQTTRQFMRLSQVQALFPLARAPHHSKELAGFQEELILDDQLEGKPAQVGFFFSHDALVMVSIVMSSQQVDRAYLERVVSGLTATYGAPSDAVDERTPGARPGFTQSVRKWVASATQIMLIATPSIRPINTGPELGEHGVVIVYSGTELAN